MKECRPELQEFRQLLLEFRQISQEFRPDFFKILATGISVDFAGILDLTGIST